MAEASSIQEAMVFQKLYSLLNVVKDMGNQVKGQEHLQFYFLKIDLECAFRNL